MKEEWFKQHFERSLGNMKDNPVGVYTSTPNNIIDLDEHNSFTMIDASLWELNETRDGVMVFTPIPGAHDTRLRYFSQRWEAEHDD